MENKIVWHQDSMSGFKNKYINDWPSNYEKIVNEYMDYLLKSEKVDKLKEMKYQLKHVGIKVDNKIDQYIAKIKSSSGGKLKATSNKEDATKPLKCQWRDQVSRDASKFIKWQVMASLYVEGSWKGEVMCFNMKPSDCKYVGKKYFSRTGGFGASYETENLSSAKSWLYTKYCN